MIQDFTSGVYLTDGAEVSVAGFHYPTRMVVIALPCGGTLLWSPVTYSTALANAVTTIGPVRHIVAPNSLHHLFMADWAAACPDAHCHGAPGLAEKRPDLPLGDPLGPKPPAAWSGVLDHLVVDTRLTTEIIAYHKPSRTVILTDLVQNFPRDWVRGWRRWVARADLLTAPRPTVPRKFRIAVRDRAALRHGIDDLLSKGVDRVVMAHGSPVATQGADALRHAFAWLKA